MATFLLSPAASYLTGWSSRSRAARCAGCRTRDRADRPQVLDLLRCPHCRDGCHGRRRTAVGALRPGHRFDLARQGYLNLLGRAAPGNADTAAMVAARERFLAGGFYRPDRGRRPRSLATAERGITARRRGGRRRRHAATTWPRLLDDALRQPARSGIAFDVSTAAARRAARAHERLGAVVADVWRRPAGRRRDASTWCSASSPRATRPSSPGAAAGRRCSRSRRRPIIWPSCGDVGLLEIQADKQDRLDRDLADRFAAGHQPSASLSAEPAGRRRRWPMLVADGTERLPPSRIDQRRQLGRRVTAADGQQRSRSAVTSVRRG